MGRGIRLPVKQRTFQNSLLHASLANRFIQSDNDIGYEVEMTTSSIPSSGPLLARAPVPETLWRYYALFFCSGFPALLYQIV